MHHLLYVSQATRPVAAADLAALVALARHHNARAGITGLLLHEGLDFLHLLEGEEPAVRALFGRICHDRRHCVTALPVDRAVAGRLFGGQPLARHELSPSRFLELAHLVSPAELGPLAAEAAAADQPLVHLLRAFVLPAARW